MNKIIPVDVSRFSFRIGRDLSVSTAKIKPGPPERIDGMTAGIVTMERDPPHGASCVASAQGLRLEFDRVAHLRSILAFRLLTQEE